MKRRRNPNQFTTDEAQTATLINTEGFFVCVKVPRGIYPRVSIKMCDKEALEPAQRIFKTKIGAIREKKIVCPPHLFPPEGKGIWGIHTTGTPAKRIMQQLKPLITKDRQKKWQQNIQRCKRK